MTDPVKLCVDCKHYWPDSERRFGFCSRDKKLSSFNPITGITYPQEDWELGLKCALEERTNGGPFPGVGQCGRDAQYFELKPTIWQRLKLWGAK